MRKGCLTQTLHRPHPCTAAARQTRGTKREGAKAGKTGRVALSRLPVGHRLCRHQPLMEAFLYCTTLNTQQCLFHSSHQGKKRSELCFVTRQTTLKTAAAHGAVFTQHSSLPCLLHIAFASAQPQLWLFPKSQMCYGRI